MAEMTPVSSSNIAAEAYNPETRVLSLQYRSGPAIYDYADVPPSVHEGFEAADSKGQFVAVHISHAYRYTKRLSEPASKPEQHPDPRREALASVQHDIWAHWTRWQLSVCVSHPDGSLTIPPALVVRWKGQMDTPYTYLSEKEKESDREQADKILACLAQLQEPKPELTEAGDREDGVW